MRFVPTLTHHFGGDARIGTDSEHTRRPKAWEQQMNPA
jgi:hypothetical protein